MDDTKAAKPKLVVLVIDHNFKNQTEQNWEKIFAQAKLRRADKNVEHTERNDFEDKLFFELHEKFDVVVDQASWDNLYLTSYLDSARYKRAVIAIPKQEPAIMGSQKNSRTIQPQLILIRCLPYALTNQWDYRNVLLGMIHSGIPCINTAKSIWLNELERPFMFAGLKEIQDRLESSGSKFPLINQYYYSHYSQMGFVPGSYPQVIKVAHVDAGMGKMKIDEHQQMLDARSIVGIHGDYATSEPYREGAHDLRIQKIGNRVRAFKRTGMSWKTNVDSLEIEEVPVEARWLHWITEASKMNGAYMDICTMDLVVGLADGEEFILEINGCGSGVPYLTEEQDYIAMADLCFQRLHDLFIRKIPLKDVEESLISKSPIVSLEAAESVVSEMNFRNKFEAMELDNTAMNAEIIRLRRIIHQTNLFVKSLHALNNRIKKHPGMKVVVVVGFVSLIAALFGFYGRS